jgi:hypothetical protein
MVLGYSLNDKNRAVTRTQKSEVSNVTVQFITDEGKPLINAKASL